MGNETRGLSFLKHLKGKWSLLLLGLLGVLLLLFGGNLGAEEERTDFSGDTEAYRAALTEEVTRLCSQVRGAGRVSVMLTLETGERQVYAENANGGIASSGGKGILLETRAPRVYGVAVVCEGGGDAAVRRELTSLLSAVLDVGTNRVYIGKGG